MQGTDAQDDDLRIVIQKLARRIRSNRSGEVSDSHIAVLFFVGRADGVSPSDLAASEHVTPPSMNRTLNILEGRGLITRDRDEDDARRVVVRATDAGRELLAETRRLREQWFGSQLAALTAEERKLLRRAGPVLRKLADR